MQFQQIAAPLLKQNKVLHVDYFSSSIIQTAKENTGPFDFICPTKQQDKLRKYFEEQQSQHEKYFNFKNKVSQQYFGTNLPQSYRKCEVSQVIESGDYFVSTPFESMTKSLFNSIQFDSSPNQFKRNFNNYKQSMLKSKNNKTFNRYSYDMSQSIIHQLNPEQISLNTLKLINSSIYKKSDAKGAINKNKLVSPQRPLTQKIQRSNIKMNEMCYRSLNIPRQVDQKRQKIKSISQKVKKSEHQTKKQRKSILDIVSKQKLIKFLQSKKCIDPKRKGIYNLDDLIDLEKFKMPYSNYLRLKTKRNIDKMVFQTKVKKKQSNLQKFQQFILEEFKMDNDSKRKLRKTFDDINYEFKMAERRKSLQKR